MDNNNSFGNTFSNLFEGMHNVEIYNICCQKGNNSNRIVKKALQLTDRSVFYSIFNSNSAVAWNAENPLISMNKQVVNDSMYNSIVNKRRTLFLLIRDFIWKLGNWKKSTELDYFLSSIDVDILYLPIYSSWYMCDFAQYIIEKIKVPVVIHASDDDYGYPSQCFYSPLYWFYRTILRKKLRKLISKCEYIDVFASNMKTEYEKIFQKPCFLIGKGVRNENVIFRQYDKPDKEIIKFIYTGNIGNRRYELLYNFGKVLDKLKNKHKALLEIYTGSVLTPTVKRKFEECDSIVYKGFINNEEVKVVQQTSDFLLYVESFLPQSISETRMSFSTKLIDYMLSGKPILAIGPSSVNSIAVLKTKNLAIVIDDERKIECTLKNIFDDNIDVEEILCNTNKYLLSERNVGKIQNEMYNRLKSLKIRGIL